MTSIDSTTATQSTVPVGLPPDVEGAAPTTQAKTPVDVGEGGGAQSIGAGGSPLPEPKAAADLTSAQNGLDTMGDTVGFNLSELIEVMFKLDLESEKANREATVDQIMTVAETQEAAADDLRSGAALTLAASVVSGASQVIGGALAVGGSIKSAAAMSSSATPAPMEAESTPTVEAEEAANTQAVSAEPTAPLVEPEPVAAPETTTSTETEIVETAEAGETTATSGKDAVTGDNAQTVARQERATATFRMGQDAQIISMRYQGISQLISGGGQAAGAALTLAGTEKQADSKEKESEATREQAIEQEEAGYAKSMTDHANKMYQTLDAIYNAMHQARSRIYT